MIPPLVHWFHVRHARFQGSAPWLHRLELQKLSKLRQVSLEELQISPTGGFLVIALVGANVGFSWSLPSSDVEELCVDQVKQAPLHGFSILSQSGHFGS